jgi:hypothetical protein
LLVVVAAILVPFIRTDQLAAPLASRLEALLGRRVEIQGKVRLRLLPSPAITARDAVLHDDPSAGLEPLAYVTSLQVGLRVDKLLTGSLVPSLLHLEGASINLAKMPDGRWNIQQALERLWRKAPADAVEAIPVSVSGSRINWRFGVRKLRFYLSDVDMQVKPGAEPGDGLDMRLSAGVSRTDRPARSYARMSARGRLGGAAPGRLVDMNLAVERSSISELLSLSGLQPRGIEGFVSARARLQGDATELLVDGRARLEEVQRWGWLFPGGAEPGLLFAGRLDLVSEQLDLHTLPDVGGELPVAVRIRLRDYWNAPRVAGLVTLRRLPLQSVRELADNLGFAAPPDLSPSGTLSGAVGYSANSGVRGTLQVTEGTISKGDVELQIPSADILLRSERVQLSLPSVKMDGRDIGRIEGAWTPDSVELKLETPGIEIERFRTIREALGLRAPEFFALWGKGIWQGNLRYTQAVGEEGLWTGELRLRGAETDLQGFSAKLLVDRAAAALRGPAFTLSGMAARLHEVILDGEYRYNPAVPHQHFLDLTVEELDASAVANLLNVPPRRSRGILARAFLRRSSELPAWLVGKGINGRFRAGRLLVRGQVLRDVSTELEWNSLRLQIRKFHGRLDQANLEANADVVLRAGEPKVSGEIRWKDYVWRGGRVRGEAFFETSGWTDDLLRNLRAQGFFSASLARLSAEQELRGLSGCYSFEFVRGQPHLELTDLSARLGSDFYSGNGTTLADGRLQIELTSDAKLIRLAGSLTGERADFMAIR